MANGFITGHSVPDGSWRLPKGTRSRRSGLDTSYRDDPDRVSMESDGLLAGIFLYPQLEEAFKKFPSDEWVRAAEEAGLGYHHGQVAGRGPRRQVLPRRWLCGGGRRSRVWNDSSCRTAPGVLGDARGSQWAGAAPGPTHRRGARRGRIGPGRSHACTRSRGTLAHPLAGVRVLDLGLGVAGPFTGRALADLGADVIKINALYDNYWNGTHMGLGVNRGKRSIALNLKDPAGREVLERLLQDSDVVTLNWRPGAAARLGLDYETLRERYPRIVYCNTRGYEKGPRSDLPGTDQNAAAMTGTEWEDGACGAGNPPLWSRSNMGDTGNALLAAIAITTALYHRDRTGEGQAVSTSIVNAGLLHTSYAWIYSDGTAPDWGQVDGDQFGLSPYYRLYQCALGGWVFLAAVTSEAQATLRTLLPGEPSGGDAGSVADWLGSYFQGATASEAFATLDDGGVPIEVVDEYFCRNLFDDPHARRLDLVSETHSSAVGRFEDPGLLVNISPSEPVIQRGPCACGEHTRDILSELGYSEAEVEAMVEGRAVLDGAQ